MPLQTLLDMTAFSNPLLRTLIPTIFLAYTLQLLFVIPSVILQTTRFQTLSETLTYIACILTSLSLPYLRVQERFRERARQMDTGRRGSVEYLSAPVPGQEFWAWRQLGGSAVVGVWAVCGLLTNTPPPSTLYPLTHLSLTSTLLRALHTTTVITLRLLPLISINSLPKSAFTIMRIRNVTPDHIPSPISTTPYITDIIGFALAIVGLTSGVVQGMTGWVFWVGVDVLAGGLLVRGPAQLSLGLGGVWGKVLVLGFCVGSVVAAALGVMRGAL